MPDISITGAEQLDRLGRALKDAGEKDLRRELYRGLNRATRPLRLSMKAGARQSLPQRGGLAARVARTGLSTRTSSGRYVGVRILAGSKAVKNPRSINQGYVFHPVFGRFHAGRVLQRVTPGAFSIPFEAGAPMVREELVAAVDTVARQIVRKVR